MSDTFKAYEGTDPYIFVSYARRDKEQVFPLLDALHGEGYRIWRDEGGIPLGSKWRETIADHIERSAVCLLFWSDASSVSQHCEAEIDEMLSEEKTIVPVFLDDTPLTPGLRMYLRRFQSVKLDEFDSDAAFVERLDREEAFKPCREDRERWHREGQIQWKLDHQGVLTIAKNEDWPRKTGYIPHYQHWHIGFHVCSSTAPWMSYWKKICSVVIHDDISAIGNFTFRGCESLTSVTIPDSVTAISKGAFSVCEGLTSVTIPDSVTAIGDRAFDWCTNLTSVTIPNSVIFIGYRAFSGCEALMKVEIPDSVTSIGDNAFWYCPSLTSVTIPDSVTSIGGYAFEGCKALTKVEIPAGAELGTGAFPEHVEIIRRPARRDDP